MHLKASIFHSCFDCVANRFQTEIDIYVYLVKYNVDDGTIAVGTTVDNVHAWIIVRDTGTGISETELPRLFDRFFRADAVRKTSTHGSGLGLAISRDIVRSHGGDITAQSEQGTGTTFVVRLPIGGRASDDGKDGSS